MRSQSERLFVSPFYGENIDEVPSPFRLDWGEPHHTWRAAHAALLARAQRDQELAASDFAVKRDRLARVKAMQDPTL